MELEIPDFSLVLLIGPSGSGKSTFARTHFLPTEVVSSDTCRAMVSDSENDQSATADAFDILHQLVAKRLKNRRLTVVDATNVEESARKSLLAIARKYHCLPAAIVFDLSEKICESRNRERAERKLSGHIIRRQLGHLRKSLGQLKWEGFRHLHRFHSEAEVNAARILRVPLWVDRRIEHGPFDIIGDLHGCADELVELLGRLGYVETKGADNPLWGARIFHHPEGRKAVFLGDLTDRGPKILETLQIVRNMVEAGSALCIAGNHEEKLLRKLRGKQVKVGHGLARTLEDLETFSEPFRTQFQAELTTFLDAMVSHYVLDRGNLVVAHAGLKEEMHGRASGEVRAFCLYGDTTGEVDEYGLPERLNWAGDYRGQATVVYGHTPVPYADWINRTINIDTGCVFGGQLTALRYPEKELVSVPAKDMYFEPARPFLTGSPSSQQDFDQLLEFNDVSGKRHIEVSSLKMHVSIQPENAMAALEAMSRFAADPRWLIYLPPTMSPCSTSLQPGFLEHPLEAFEDFRAMGISEVVCQEKHMGSRAVVIVTKSPDVAERRFGPGIDGEGIILTRRGRAFFEDRNEKAEILTRVRSAVSGAGLWEELQTDWLCLDCELMPWSAKAIELVRLQYAAVGAAGTASLAQVRNDVDLLVGREDVTGDEDFGASTLARIFEERSKAIRKYVEAYRRYCWNVDSPDDYRLAPFHVLAAEGQVFTAKDHLWHMDVIRRLVEASDSPVLMKTPYRVVSLSDEASVAAATNWWLELTAQGGEGMVVKSREFASFGRRGLQQPAIKVRGQEYLRMIYGPDYLRDENLARLRSRNLGRKRGLALREFALGVEALHRFVQREPLRKVHECVFGVLALESEVVDPRL